MRATNPALNEKTFANVGRTYAYTDVMSIQGTVDKIGRLLVLVIATTTWMWMLASTESEAVYSLLTVGGVGGLVVTIVTVSKQT